MAGGFPEVVRYPHIETPTRVGGKDVLFKGVHPKDFWRAFEKGGFHPLHPERPWLTNHLDTALNYGGFSPINNPSVRTRAVEDGCVIVTKPGLSERKHLQAVGSGEGPLLAVGLKDYKGDDMVKWDDLSKIVLTPHALESVLEAYSFVRPGDLSAEEFSDLIEVVEPTNAEGFRTQVRRIVEVYSPRSSRVFRPW